MSHPHDNGLGHVALLYLRARERILDGDDDDVAKLRITPSRATKDFDALDALRAGVVRHLQDRAHLNHGSLLHELLHDARDDPALLPTDRPMLLDFDFVAHFERAPLVVR